MGLFPPPDVRAVDPVLMQDYPAVADLAKRAHARIPFFAWEYLDSGTGAEYARDRNIEALQRYTFTPKFMRGEFQPQIETTLFGQTFAAPFGIAPVGLTGLMWPGAELILAKVAGQRRIPFSLSTVATETPESIGPLAGDMSWFQLYPPREPEMRKDLLKRAADSGFTTCLVTADVPGASMRERQKRAEVAVPPRQTIKTYVRAAIRPAWALATLQHGLPRFRMLEKYASVVDMQQASRFVSQKLGGTLSWDYLDEVRQEWPGNLVVKGIMDVDDARECVARGMDGIVVSNHGARQFDGARASIDALAEIAPVVGDDLTILFDSGVRGGLDICRALALGADFAMLGRAFIYSVAALGERGPGHLIDLLSEDMRSCMTNMGCSSLAELSERLDR